MALTLAVGHCGRSMGGAWVGWARGRDMGVTGIGVVSWGHGRGAMGRVWVGQGRGMGIHRAPLLL